MATETMLGVEALLAQERWVRRLARALVHDDDEAEDVVQETRLAWWRLPPRDQDRARSWLGTVVRNVVRNRKRAAGIRQRVQGELATADAAVPSAERLAERLEIHRELAEEVARLPEPFRQVVLLRYYEDVSCAEIARRLGEPAGTIRWRLMTGLERLRAALDERRDGARSAWLAALVPLAQTDDRSPSSPPAPGSPTTAPGRTSLVRIAALALALGVVGVVAGVVMLGRSRAGAPLAVADPPPSPPGGSVVRGPLGNSWPVARLAAASGVNPSGPGDDLPAWIQLEGVPRRDIAGRVVSNGRPVGGARLRLSSGTLRSARYVDRHTVSGQDGAFAFPGQPITDWLLTAWAPDLQPVILYLDLRQATPGSTVAGHAIDALVIDLAPCRVFVRGTVRDADGGVLASARVRFVAGSEASGTATRTDRGGRYQLCVPGGSRQARVLTAEASGYGAVEARAPSETGTVDVVLEPQAVVAGRAVWKASGQPVAGVDLLLHPLAPPGRARAPGEDRAPASRVASTDEGGRFELTGVAPGRYGLAFASDQAFGGAGAVLNIASGEQRRDLEVGLVPVAVVDGVVSRQGAPAAHADLRFTPSPGVADSTGPRRARSDQQGRFRVRVPQDMPLTIETPASPGLTENARWTPVLAPATLLAGRPHRSGVRVELPAEPAATEAREFVTPPGASAPAPGRPLDGRFGNQVRLLGYDLTNDHVQRGGELEVTLHFQVLAPLDGVRLFSHLVGPGGFANLDHAPVRGLHPVPRWRVGETIRDRFSIRVPATFSPGVYTLLAGFWRPDENRRLTVSPATSDAGDGRLRVVSFTVD